MNLAVTILTDNLVERGEGLLGEHGLSLLVEAGESRVLLDAGQTDLCIRNAQRLGANLGDVETVVLSHGHYDHGGGLPSLLNEFGSLKIIAHPDAFAPKYARRRGEKDRYIGLARDAEGLRSSGAVVSLETQARELGPNLLTTGPIPRITDFEQNQPHFWIKAGSGWQPDPLQDDQALIARTGEGLVMLLGCAHAGAVNTLHHAMRLTGEKRIRAVVGGLHLTSASPERIEQTVAALQELAVEQVVACHCTGFLAQMHLHAALGDRSVNGNVGLRLTF